MCHHHVSLIPTWFLLDGYVRLVCCVLTLHVNRFMWWLILRQFQMLLPMVNRYARPVTLQYLLLLLSQFGEYFGFSIAAPDLNGDGWVCETVSLHHSTPLSSAMMILVVGAPMYSETGLPELGRIFILYNNAVSAMACVLPDTSV